MKRVAPFQSGGLATFETGACIQHPGTDSSLWAGHDKSSTKENRSAMAALRAATRDPAAARARYADLPFVLDQLTALNTTPGPLQARLDMGRVGMAGHSYGARSVLTAAGEAARPGRTPFKESRIKAAVALSPNVPERALNGATVDPSSLYGAVDIPLFHITGTRDGHPFHEGFDPVQRTLPFQGISAPGQYLLVFDGAEHSDFGGRGKNGRVQQATARGAVLFFDAYLQGKEGALKALREEFPRTLGPGDRFAFK